MPSQNNRLLSELFVRNFLNHFYSASTRVSLVMTPTNGNSERRPLIISHWCLDNIDFEIGADTLELTDSSST